MDVLQDFQLAVLECASFSGVHVYTKPSLLQINKQFIVIFFSENVVLKFLVFEFSFVRLLTPSRINMPRSFKGPSSGRMEASFISPKDGR